MDILQIHFFSSIFFQGIDNYVRHRKEGKCGVGGHRGNGAKEVEEKKQSEAAEAAEEVVDDEGEDASAVDMDDFLQYFQLQHVKPSTADGGTESTGFKVRLLDLIPFRQ